jgi:hypothetical protein
VSCPMGLASAPPALALSAEGAPWLYRAEVSQ